MIDPVSRSLASGVSLLKAYLNKNSCSYSCCGCTEKNCGSSVLLRVCSMMDCKNCNLIIYN